MMYKIEDGKLITPPTVWKGIIGYDNDLERLEKDGWFPLVVKGEGENIEYIQHKDYIEEKHSEPPYDYRALRAAAYPPLGDMIDAFCKAYEGNDKELLALMAQRNIIKQSIKKEKDAN